MIVKPVVAVPIAVVILVLWYRRDHYSRRGLAVRLTATLVVAAVAQVLLTAAAGATVPTISSLSPNHGSVAGGEQVTINGSNFLGPGNACNGGYQIWFGTDLEHGYAIAAPSYRVLSDSQIQVAAPPNFGGGVDVRVHNACGTSDITAGDQFAYDYPASQCRAGSCAVTVSAATTGAIGHVADGFLDGFNTDAGVTISPAQRSLVAALHPRQWRLGQAGIGEPGGGVFGLARGAGAQISLDLTSDWQDWAYTNDRPYYTAPYGDLSTYSSFIASDVRQRLAAGQVPDYFDVWNEPSSSATVNQWLSVYGAAYHAIKSVDPNAQVVGPSIPSFLLASAGHPDTPGYQLSLSDFLGWEVSSGVRMAAISWHEDGTTVQQDWASGGSGLPARALPGGFRDYWSPMAIASHVARAKALIASYPALRATKVFVNEYGPTYAVNIPGWLVGDFSALESARADQGMITCVSDAACMNLLDGLLGSDGQPQMPYWVVRAYGQMSGQRVATQTSGSNLYALASRDDGARTLTALIGRADNCWGGQQCPQFHASSAAGVGLTVSAAVPWGLHAVNVTVQVLANRASAAVGANDVASPPPVRTLSNVPVSCGAVKVAVPSVGDGDAVVVTITAPAGTSRRVAGVPQSSRAPGLPLPNCVAYGARAQSRRVTLRRTRTRTRRTPRRHSSRP